MDLQNTKKTSYDLGYKLTLTRDTDNAVLNKDNAINNAKNKINAKEWYVPHYTPSTSSQAIVSKQVLNKSPTKLQYVERSVFLKKVKIQNFRTFHLNWEDKKVKTFINGFL